MGKNSFPVDHGWAWVIAGGCFMCVFFMGGLSKSMGMFLPEFQEYFNVSTSVASMLMGTSFIVYAVSAPVLIMMGQLFSIRKVMLFSTLIAFVGMSFSSLLLSVEYVIATFGVSVGFGNAALYGNCLVMLGNYFDKRRTLANGLALTGSAIGQFAMPPIIEFLLDVYGLSGCLLMVSGVYFHTFLACCLFRPASFWFRSDEEKSTPPNNEPLVSPSILTEKVAVNGDPSSQRLRPMELPSPIMFCQACGDESMQRVRCNTEGSLGMSKYKPHVTLASMSDHGVHDGSDTGRTERTIVNQIDIRHIDTRHMCKSPFFSSCTGMNGMEPKQSFHFIDPTKLQMIYSKTSSISTLYGSSILQFPPELEQYDLDDSGMEKVQPTFGFCGVLADMFNFSLLKSYVAVFMLTTGFLAFFGQYNFIIFLPASLIERGITKYDKAMLTSISGAGDLFGRVLVAVCGDRIVVARYNVQAVGMIAVGVNIGVFVFADRFSWMAVHIVLYGFFGGIYIAFFGVVMIDFVGVKRMPKLLAVVVLIQGIGAALGQPLLGAIHDRTDSYHLVHVICSLSCLSGGLLLLCYPIILKLEGSRPEKYQLVPRTSTI